MSYIPLISAERLAADAVTSAKILEGTITNADINAAAAIALSKLATDPLARANHTGTQTASTISDFDTQVQTNSIDELADAAADVGMGGFKITGLGGPSSSSDAATKSYVDGIAAGLVDYKASVRAVATSNITLSGLQTIDGVSVVASDRVAVTGQTTGSENGLYTASAGTWVRTTDADTSAEVTAGMYFAVEEGTTYSDSVWLLVTDNPITLNTTSLSFIELPTVQDLVAGAGITKSGNTINVGAGTGITVNADDVAIDTAVVPRLGAANSFTSTNDFSGAATFTGGVVLNVATDADNHTASMPADSGKFFIMTATGGPATITLPASHTAGQHVYVKRNHASNSVFVATADTDTIDGSSSDLELTQDQETALIVSDGTNWHRF